MLLGRYDFFTNKMDSDSMTVESNASVAARSGRLTYYVAIACILAVAFFFRSRRQRQLEVPYYKASLTKWIFDAENLVRESYNKVSSCNPKLVPQEGS